jgi:hypothetical protein
MGSLTLSTIAQAPQNLMEVTSFFARSGMRTKKIVVALVITMALSMAGFVLVSAQDKYTVSGEVRYTGESNIYVCLNNQDTFRAFVGPDKEMPPSGFVKVIKADGAGRAPSAFADVPEGEYLIIVFADCFC